MGEAKNGFKNGTKKGASGEVADERRCDTCALFAIQMP